MAEQATAAQATTEAAQTSTAAPQSTQTASSGATQAGAADAAASSVAPPAVGLTGDTVLTEPIKADGAAVDPAKAGETAALDANAAQPATEAAAQAESSKPEPKPGPPERYDLKLPDNSGLDNQYLENIAAYAKAKGYSQEQAQTIVNHDIESRKRLAETSETWKRTAMSDPEIGGQKWKESAELAKRIVEEYGTDTLKGDLARTGLGNNPEIMRFLVRLAKASNFAEDKVVNGSSPRNQGPKKSVAQTLYPNMK